MDRRIFIQSLAATTYGVKALNAKPIADTKAKKYYFYLLRWRYEPYRFF